MYRNKERFLLSDGLRCSRVKATRFAGTFGVLDPLRAGGGIAKIGGLTSSVFERKRGFEEISVDESGPPARWTSRGAAQRRSRSDLPLTPEHRRLSESKSLFFVLVAFALPADAQAPVDPHALLVHADRVRNAWQEGVLKLKVTTTKPG